MSIEENAALEAEHDAAVALREHKPLELTKAAAGEWLEGCYVVRARFGIIEGFVPRNKSPEARAEAKAMMLKEQRKDRLEHLEARRKRSRSV